MPSLEKRSQRPARMASRSHGSTPPSRIGPRETKPIPSAWDGHGWGKNEANRAGPSLASVIRSRVFAMMGPRGANSSKSFPDPENASFRVWRKSGCCSSILSKSRGRVITRFPARLISASTGPAPLALFGTASPRVRAILSLPCPIRSTRILGPIDHSKQTDLGRMIVPILLRGQARYPLRAA